MGFLGVKIFFLGIGILLATSCADTSVSRGSLFSTPSPPRPAEEILINNSDFNKPYKILGPVQYTLRSRVSLLSDQIEFREKAIDALKTQTYSQFGDAVDAIIDTKVEESTVDSIEGKFSVTRIQGLAISFQDETDREEKSTAKPIMKRKHKSAKKIIVMRKAKPVKRIAEKVTDKPKVEEEVEISPTEMLK